MICPKCGAEIMDKSTLCVKCGANLKDDNINNVVNNQITNSNIETPSEVAIPGIDVEQPKENEETEEVVKEEIIETTPTEDVVEEKYEETKVDEKVVEEPTLDSPVTEESKEENVVETPIINTSTEEKIEQPSVDVETINTPVSNDKKKANPLLFIVLGVLALVIVISLVIKLIPLKEGKTNIEDQFTTNLILITEDNKYGYIDTNGNQVIEPIYKSATEFYGNYALVKKVEEVEEGEYYKYLTEKVTYYIIDKKGEIKLTSNKYIDNIYGTTSYDHIEGYDRWIFDGKIYDENLKQLSPDEVIVMRDLYYTENNDYIYWQSEDAKKIGIISVDGKVTYTYEVKDNQTSFELKFASEKSKLKDQYCSIEYYSNGTYMSNIVNCATGKVIVDFEPKEYYAGKGNTFNYTNYKTKEYLSETVYIENDKIELSVGPAKGAYIYYNEAGFLTVRENDKSDYYYYDLSTKTKSDSRPEKTTIDIDEIDSRLGTVNLENVWERYTGYKKDDCGSLVGLSKDSKVILSCDWDKIEYLDLDLYKYLETKGKKYIYAYKNKKWNIVDIKTGEIVFELDDYTIEDSNISPIIYYKTSNSTKMMLNLLTLKTMEIDRYNEIKIYSGYFTLKDGKILKYYNNDFKLIYTKE